MKVKLLKDGGFSGIAYATNFNWDMHFEVMDYSEEEQVVVISLEELIKGGYDLSAANSGEVPEGYVIQGKSRTFLLWTNEAIIVEED